MKGFVRVVALFVWSCSPPPPVDPPGPPASAGRFTIECLDRGVRAYDASRTVIDGVPLDCSVRLAQRNGEPVAGRSITVLVEAGRFTIDPATSESGGAALRLETGMPLPRDVVPVIFSWSPLNDATHTGEYFAPLWMVPYQWSENPSIPTVNFSLREPRRPDPVRLKPDGTRFENNPRDNLVTIVAYTDGEEAFVDNNANGTFDPGELFTDLTEPFVDSDDDGTRGEGEEFVDTNGNGQWDGKNGLWDAQTKIWTQQRVLWTGIPAELDMQMTVMGVTGNRPVVSPSRVSLSCPSGVSMCSMAGSSSNSFRPVTLSVQMSDPWFNRLAHEGSNDGCSLTSSPLVVLTPTRFDLPQDDVWAATQFLRLTIADARTGPSPVRSPPEMFTVSFICDFSASRGRPADRFVFNALQGMIE